MLNSNLTLNVLFHFQAKENVESVPSDSTELYRIITMFTDLGAVSDKIIEGIYLKEYSAVDIPHLCFRTLEQLVHFVETVVKRQEYSEALLLSSVDYNLGLDTAHHERDIKDIFRRFGTTISTAPKRSKLNILSRFFR